MSREIYAYDTTVECLLLAQSCQLWMLGEGLKRAQRKSSLQCSLDHAPASDADGSSADIAVTQPYHLDGRS
jgi:hypothetical protein